MTTEIYFGKRENAKITDAQALVQSLDYIFHKTEATHGCILVFLQPDEIMKALESSEFEKRNEGTNITVIFPNGTFVNIFSFYFFRKIGVSINKLLQGYRFDCLSIIGRERMFDIDGKVAAECMRRFEYLT